LFDRRRITILLADDDEDDRHITRSALEEARVLNDFRTVGDGVELLDYLRRRGQYADAELSPRPDLILLDLNMPRMNGREALAAIKEDPALRSIPVVALTTSTAEADIANVYALGASSYVTKPVTFPELVDIMGWISRYWIEIVESPPAGEAL
jgi:two-component system response regulator